MVLVWVCDAMSVPQPQPPPSMPPPVLVLLRRLVWLWGGRVTAVAPDARDAKTALQEWVQARGEAPPAYTEIDRQGPDHAPVFTVEVMTDTGHAARAAANSKRQAEQAAARTLLARLEKSHD